MLSKVKRKVFSYLVIVSMLIGMMPIGAFVAPITDLSNRWAKEQVTDWIEKDLVKGYPDGTFKAGDLH